MIDIIKRLKYIGSAEFIFCILIIVLAIGKYVIALTYDSGKYLSGNKAPIPKATIKNNKIPSYCLIDLIFKNNLTIIDKFAIKTNIGTIINKTNNISPNLT